MCSTYLSNLLKLNWKVYPKLAFCSKSILVSFFCGTYFGECSNCSFQYKESIVPSTKNLLKPFKKFFFRETDQNVCYLLKLFPSTKKSHLFLYIFKCDKREPMPISDPSWDASYELAHDMRVNKWWPNDVHSRRNIENSTYFLSIKLV